MSAHRPLRVFLSCSEHDLSIARAYYEEFRAAGWIQPWLEEEDLLPGQDSRLEIERAVRNADVVLVFLSSRSVSQEGQIQRQLKLTLDVADEKPEGTVFVIPIRLDDCSLPHRLRTWTPVDAFPADRRERAYERILSSLKIRATSAGLLPENTDAPTKKEIRRPRFYSRALHLEFRVNADASVVNNYLLQHYDGVSEQGSAAEFVYWIENIEYFSPSEHDIFQYSLIASGYKLTAVNGYFKVGEAEATADPKMELIPEMFFITLSQGQRDISIINFDTDIKNAYIFAVGLMRELKKAFSIELLNPMGQSSDILSKIEAINLVTEKQNSSQLQSKPTPPTGDINITIHGNVSGNLVIGNENQVNGTRDENKPKGSK